MTPRLSQARLEGTALVFAFSDGAPPARAPLFWLRDQCRCPDCHHPMTGQRLVDTFALELKPVARSAVLLAGGETLALAWADGHESVYPAALLHDALAGDEPPETELWTAEPFAETMPQVAFQAVMDSHDGLSSWLTALARYGFCLVRGVPPTVEDTARLARRIGYIRESVFGGLWQFTDDMTRGDTAYTNLFLDLHTDGTYSHDAPGLQMLHCLLFAGTGAESLLVDGFGAAEELRRVDADAFALLCRVPILGQYFEDGIHLRARRPALRTDGQGRLVQVSFNNSDRAPLLLPAHELRDLYRALAAFSRVIHEPARVLRFVLEPGTALIFDNWRTLHGRTAYTGQRHMCGCYLNHEDFESRLRLVRAARMAEHRPAESS